MSEVAVARRYADALFQLGNEKGTTDQMAKEFEVLKTIFNNNEQMISFLKHPRVNNEKKKQFIDEVFQSFSADVVNMLHLLRERHRYDVVPSIIDHFIHLVNDAKGIEEATVYSVRELSQTEKQRIEDTFAKRVDKQAIKLKTVVDPSVLGGIKLRIGNTIYDGTLKGKLQRLERNITTAN
ncbi:F0F1 ATP synthase subunit delta [Lentibacillus cibarius]|uniref:ATP synthase subunit delta n=1 Tax=Lentibacillus cibarius TaxID=2583219 RepID=A0A549YFU8_9BACI|nr:F0F1 ATP synthase subunit delta [Lentibacillus cibarius]TMN21995.1 F0F1 ATP synthase subunit delta [Lentibacillus cibarius]TRM10762.1 F0F1 ATP synthase subunit delta [Lentibacillus cibarius]